MKVILEEGHSRVPVFHEHPRNIIGLVLVINYCQTTSNFDYDMEKLIIVPVFFVYITNKNLIIQENVN